MGKKNHQKTIRSLLKRIDEHREKIRNEYRKESPDERIIHHWQAEIDAFGKGIQQARKRLER